MLVKGNRLNALRYILLAAFTLAATLSPTLSGRTAAEQTAITVNPQTTYQTIIGWEAEAQSGQADCSGFANYSSSLFDQAVNDLGINRLRVGISPASSTATTFDLSANSYFVGELTKVAIPMKQRLEAKGEKLFINVNFGGDSGFTSQPNMSKYAQEVLRTYQYMQANHGFVPDAWEVALEPGVVSADWTPKQIGDAIVATASLLKSNGYTPYFIAPSNPGGAGEAISYLDQMVQQVPGVFPYLKEFAYHRYNPPSDDLLRAVASRGQQYGIKTAQLEHGGADYNELHKDLKLANVSAWQQFALAYCDVGQWVGYQYYEVNGNAFSISSSAKFLRQYFKFIRAGAVRIGASTSNGSHDPLSFINKDGKYVVVVNASTSGSFSIAGLPAGTYGIKYTTYGQYNIDSADISIGAGQALSTSIPDTGVITIYQKSSSSMPPATQTPTRTPTPRPFFSVSLPLVK